MAKGYVNIENTTAEEILSAIEFDTSGEPIDFGTFMTIQEFIEKINDWEILDFLGSAYLEIDNKITENTVSWIWFRAFEIGDKFIVSFDKLEEIFGNRLRVLWVKKEEMY